MVSRQDWNHPRRTRVQYPYACVGCRKSFKRNVEWRQPPAELPCPHCGGAAIGLSRNFKPPAQNDVAQWAKVKALIDAGFRFEHVEDATGRYQPYPATLGEVKEFIRRYPRRLANPASDDPRRDFTNKKP